ncbi:uncharacterized protein DUF982 [Mesorhizobium sp. J18]|nr:uncharacterized protein DUF982 [Mesorhizobium sp. J18]
MRTTTTPYPFACTGLKCRTPVRHLPGEAIRISQCSIPELAFPSRRGLLNNPDSDHKSVLSPLLVAVLSRLLNAFKVLEELMNEKMFNSPIFVRDGSYLVQEIATLEDAIDFLESWPERKRDLIHERALDSCYAAFDGRKPLVAAYIAFTGFAKRADILEDYDAVMPWLAASQEGTGRVPA